MNHDRIYYNNPEENDGDLFMPLVIAELTVATFGIVSNVGFMTYILSKHALRTSNSSAFAISLSLADVLVCSVVMVVNTLNRRSLMVGLGTMELCRFWSVFSIFACTASSYNIVAIAVDRYICAGDPLNYYSHMPRKVLYLTLVFLWVSCFLIAFIPVILGRVSKIPVHLTLENRSCKIKPDKDYIIVITTLTIFLPCFIVIYIYSHIFVMAYRRTLHIRRSIRLYSPSHQHTQFLPPQQESVRVSAKMLADPTQGSQVNFLNEQPSRGNASDVKASEYDPFDPASQLPQTGLSVSKTTIVSRLFSTQAKATITLTLIVGIFNIHWLPFGIIKVLLAVKPGSVPPSLERISLWLLLTHSCWNPLIFFLCNSSFRAGFWKACANCRRQIQIASQTDTYTYDYAENRTTYKTSVLFPQLIPLDLRLDDE